MTTPDFTIAVGPWTGVSPSQAVTFFRSWTLDKNIDDGCTFSFVIPGFAPEAAVISELDTDVWMYRSGTLYQRFRIIAINQQWGASGEDEISVQAVCYRRLLATRYITSPLNFNQVSQGQIIMDLINHTQSQTNGWLSITPGSLGPTILRDRNYEVGQNILDVIVDLTNADGGPTWDIDENLQLNVSRADLYPTHPAPLVLGATVESMQRPSAANKFGNVAVISGNQSSTSTVVAESPTMPSDPRGRWERRASYPNVITDAVLNDQALGLLGDLQSATTIWQVSVVPERYFSDANYELGDFVELVQPASTAAPIGQPAVTLFAQILAIQIQQDNAGATSVSMRVLEFGPPGVTVFGASTDSVSGGFRIVSWESGGFINVFGPPLTNVEYLLVGGGGSGGSSGAEDSAGGGGGGGGVLTGTLPTLRLSQLITIGQGGVNIPLGQGMDGTSTRLGGLLEAFGGGGGGSPGFAGNNGGCGGGAGSGGTTFSSGVSGQGTAGGNSAFATNSGAGGGGAGTIGGNGLSTAAGSGGGGKSSSILGGPASFGGGGAGGRYPGDAAGTTSAGGGASGNNGPGGNGSNLFGGGGGGAGRDTGGPYAGGSGGSGVLVLKWAV